jgi:hypothetical protein
MWRFVRYHSVTVTSNRVFTLLESSLEFLYFCSAVKSLLPSLLVSPTLDPSFKIWNSRHISASYCFIIACFESCLLIIFVWVPNHITKSRKGRCNLFCHFEGTVNIFCLHTLVCASYNYLMFSACCMPAPITCNCKGMAFDSCKEDIQGLLLGDQRLRARQQLWSFVSWFHFVWFQVFWKAASNYILGRMRCFCI